MPTLYNRVVIFSMYLLSDISAAKLSFGSSVEISQVKRGDDLYLECNDDANPGPHKNIWEKDSASNILPLHIAYKLGNLLL